MQQRLEPGSTAMSFQEKRRKELGLAQEGNKRSFQEKRKMQLGMIPSDLTVEEMIPKTKDYGPRPAHQVMEVDTPKPIQPVTGGNNGSLGIGDIPTAPSNNAFQQDLDYVFKDNPIARVLNYLPGKIAEYSVPNSPMIGNREDGTYGNLTGTNARQEHAERNPVRSTGFEGLDKAGDVAGQIGSYFLNPAGPGQGPVALYNAARNIGATKLAQKATNPIKSNLGKRMANEAIQEGATAATYAVPRSLMQGETSPEEIAKNVGIEGSLGVVGGAAMHAIGKGLRVALDKLAGRSKNKEAIQEILALPEPKQRGNVNTAQTPDVINVPPSPTKARRGKAEPNQYEMKLNRLFEEANKLEQQGKLPAGRELETVEDLWSRMAEYTDPSLDELIDLAYPKQRAISPNALSKGRTASAAGLGPNIRRLESTSNDVIPETINKPNNKPMTKEQLEVMDMLGSKTETPIQDARREALGIKPNPAKSVDNQIDEIDEFDEITEGMEVPKIRDRVNSLADKWIEEAMRDIKSNRISSNPIDVYGKLGTGYMLKGAVKFTDWSERMVKEFGEEIRPRLREIFNQSKEQYTSLRAQVAREELGIDGFSAQKLKDLTSLNLNTADVYRNFKKVFGDKFPAVKKAILDPFDEAKGRYTSTQKYLLRDLRYVTNELGIKKGSRLSALTQKYGEGTITLDKLKQEAPDKWKDVVKADQFFRNAYDQLLGKVNETIKQIYPTRPDKIVPKRDNYYRHFQELKGFSGLKNLFDTPSQIDPSLAGISQYTQPKTKWASFKQKRGLGEFKNDAVGGFLEYIPAASYAIHIDPQISVFRNLAKELSTQTGNTRNLNNFIKFIRNYADDLSGKTSPLDRWVEELGGRKTLQVMNWANNRVKSNVILGNVRSTLSQLANIPNGIAFGGTDALPGMMRTMHSIIEPNPAMQKSNFLNERYIGKDFRQFDTRLLEQPRRFSEWMIETSDRIGTSFIWNTAYAKGVKEGVKNPVKYADDNTRRLIAGRGIGEQPLLQKSKVFQVVAPFQLEVGNLWRVMKDFVDERQFGKLATLFAASFLFNKGMERITGSGVVFDPIDAFIDAFTEEDLSALERGGRIAGEVLSNVPLGQNAASWYPEYGKNIYGVQLPTREKLFGDKDPTRFGEGLVLTKGIQDPLFKMILPFGGNQLKKSIQGADAIIRGGSYTDNITTTGVNIEEPEFKFKIDSSPAEIIRSALFGPYATASGREYYKNERRPLSEKQTQAYLNSNDPDKYYNTLMKSRKLDTYKRKISEIKKDKDLSIEEKKEDIANIIKQIQELNN
jgi:hypothetical protein